MQKFWQWFGPRTAALMTAVAILAGAPAMAEAAPRGGGHGGGHGFSGGGMGGGGGRGFSGGGIGGGSFRAAPGPRISGGSARSFGSVGRGPRMRGPGYAGRGMGRPGAIVRPGRHVKPGGPHHHHGHKHHRRPYVIYGSPFLYNYYYDDYYYDAPAVGYGDCDWLYRKARSTGKSYWWRRYEQCMNY